MADPPEDFLAYATHLREEHHRLGDRLRRVEGQWASLPEQPDAAAAAAQLLEGVKELRAELAHHFEEEESGGCLEEAVTRRPSLSHEATRLEHEHAELLAQLDRLIETLGGPQHSLASLQAREAEFRGLAKQLRAHEAAENHILEECFGIEVE